MVAELSRWAKHVREQIEDIETQAAEVDSPTLKEAALNKITELRVKLYQIVATATEGQHTADDVEYWAQSVMARGGRFPTFDTKVIKGLASISKVPNASLREGVLRFLEDGTQSYTAIILTMRERLETLERISGKDHGSATWSCDTEVSRANSELGLRRRLGLKSVVERGFTRCAFLIEYEEAVAISQAIGMHPQQAGV
jgi:hypothetical protein